jgi:hypothetical protein
MAYIDQATKAAIASNLRKIIPAGWKYSLAINHRSTLILTIQSAPVDLLGAWLERVNERRAQSNDEPLSTRTHASINGYWLADQFTGDLLDTFRAILSAMNAGNHDNSDPQTDYFDVGWYTEIRLGRWDKPFVCAECAQPA